MFDKIKILVTNHAFGRFKERIDPTATLEQIKGYVRESIPSRFIQRLHGKLDARQIVNLYPNGIAFYARHMVFIIQPTRCKGSLSVNVVTCYRNDETFDKIKPVLSGSTEATPNEATPNEAMS